METLRPFDNHNDDECKVWIVHSLLLINRLHYRKRCLIAVCLAISTLFCGWVMASSVPALAVADERADFSVQVGDSFDNTAGDKTASYPPLLSHCQPASDSAPPTNADLPCWGSATLNSTLSTSLDSGASVVADLDDFNEIAILTPSLCDQIRAGPGAVAEPLYQSEFIPPSHRVLHCVLRL